MPALLKIVCLIILVMQLSFVVTHLLVYDHTHYVPTVMNTKILYYTENGYSVRVVRVS